MYTIDSERLSATLASEDVQSPSQSSMVSSSYKIKKLVAEGDGPYIRLNEYKVSKNNLER